MLEKLEGQVHCDTDESGADPDDESHQCDVEDPPSLTTQHGCVHNGPTAQGTAVCARPEGASIVREGQRGSSDIELF
ncbi:hypothetical protein SCMU_24830 [Sinomonas cyclohexanicum]|uniref:Uncharacterized protein n=1 Tax=Sinomonas cyclohexanicum TaxID=322009 RepID=A0ABN6FIQ0_SINCY|nr:hypothetical protein SCMU_24830 [Corynebacterium cyclohexanicum]